MAQYFYVEVLEKKNISLGISPALPFNFERQKLHAVM